jgi:hypothetical protein
LASSQSHNVLTYSQSIFNGVSHPPSAAPQDRLCRGLNPRHSYTTASLEFLIHATIPRGFFIGMRFSFSLVDDRFSDLPISSMILFALAGFTQIISYYS